MTPARPSHVLDQPLPAVPGSLARNLSILSTFALCVLLPVVMVVANKSAPAMLAVGSVLANAAALAAIGPHRLVRRYRTCLLSGTAVTLAVLTIVALLSFIWTIDPAMTRRGLIEGLPELLFGWGLAAAWPAVLRRSDLRLLPVGIIGAALLIVVEARFGMHLHKLAHARAQDFDLKRSVVPLVLLLWPTCALLARQVPRWLLVLLFPVVLVPAGLAHSAASVVAVIVSAVLFGATRFWPRVTLSAVAAASMLLLVATPWTGTIAGAVISERAASVLREEHASHRVRIWQAFEHHIRDKHLFGHGFDTSFRISDLVESDGTAMPGDRVIDDIHPHDVLLQVWIELGLFGAVLAAVAIVFITMRLASYGAALRAPRLAFVASAAIVALVGITAWAPWWLAMLALCLVLFKLQVSTETVALAE